MSRRNLDNTMKTGSTTTATFQAPIDIDRGIQDEAWLRAADKNNPFSWTKTIFLAKKNYAEGDEDSPLWGVPEFRVTDAGVVINKFSASGTTPRMTKLKLLLAPNANMPFDPTWGGTGPDMFSTATLTIRPTTGDSGVLIVYPTTGGSTTLEKVLADTVIYASAGDTLSFSPVLNTKRTVGDIEVVMAWELITAPTSTLFDIAEAMMAGFGSATALLSVEVRGADTDLFYPSTPTTYGFRTVALELEFGDAVIIDTLCEKLSALLSEDMYGVGAPEERMRSVVVTLPTEIMDNPEGLITRVRKTNARIQVSADMIQVTDFIDGKYTQAIGNSDIIHIASRVSPGTITFCDGTTISKEMYVDYKFIPAAGGTILWKLTGCAFQALSPERLDFQSDDGDISAEFVIWDGTNTGNYTLNIAGDGEHKIWQVDDEALTWYKHRDIPLERKFLPLLTLDRTRGYTGLGCGKDVSGVADRFLIEKDLRGNTIAAGDAMPWKDTLLGLRAPDVDIDDPDKGRAGLLFQIGDGAGTGFLQGYVGLSQDSLFIKAPQAFRVGIGTTGDPITTTSANLFLSNDYAGVSRTPAQALTLSSNASIGTELALSSTQKLQFISNSTLVSQSEYNYMSITPSEVRLTHRVSSTQRGLLLDSYALKLIGPTSYLRLGNTDSDYKLKLQQLKAGMICGIELGYADTSSVKTTAEFAIILEAPGIQLNATGGSVSVQGAFIAEEFVSIETLCRINKVWTEAELATGIFEVGTILFYKPTEVLGSRLAIRMRGDDNVVNWFQLNVTHFTPTE